MRRKPAEEKRPKGEVVKVPIDTTSEAVLIGACAANPQAAATYLMALGPELFFGSGHASMWRALRELRRQGLGYSPDACRAVEPECDVKTLDSYASSHRELGPNLRLHADRVRWNKTKHDAAEGSVARFIEALRDGASTPEKMAALASQVQSSFSGQGSRYLRNSQDIVEEHAKELEERRQGRALFPFGLPGLDFYGPDDYAERKVDGRIVQVSLEGKPRMIPGARPGDVTVVTGESGHGKTTAMAQMILSMLPTRRVLWGAWEQQNGASLELLATMHLELSRADMMSGRFSAEDKRLVLEEMSRLGSRVRFFDLPFDREADAEERTNRENLSLIHQHVAESGCDVFVADLFSDSLEDSEPQAEARALRKMKAMALACQCHVFLVHWLRFKGLADRQDKRPTRDLVMGSGAWIGKSDNVLGFYRPGGYGGPKDKLECHILKQRHGDHPLAVEFDWDGEYGSITNGRTLPVLVGPSGMDDLLGEMAAPPRHSRKRKAPY